ncbi:putative Mitochondrial ribosomal protein L51 / S25 / CI-B8 domain containing protein [Leishmania utingensis]|uniref:Large ribosomal subunit protein mL43 n=1 Tax=Leishmania utingensis TaxID=653362 RepID=A0AAW3A487_9TRYP
MSRNGELCLQKIIVSYSPNKGNPAMRQFMATYLPEFYRQYPQVKIDIRPRQWPESSITGVYRDGSEKAYSICFLSSMGINVRFHRLVNEGNDYNHSFSASHLHMQRRSVQGVWNPYLWNYEGTRTRHKPPAKWNRKLTEREWDYYIQQYGAQMKAEEDTITDRVRRYTDIPEASTEEVQQRWKEHVMPRLQTDLEYNLSHWKKQHLSGARRPSLPTLKEYSLFSVPDHSSLGQDAIDMLRRREAQREEEWWRERKGQLKPPK